MNTSGSDIAAASKTTATDVRLIADIERMIDRRERAALLARLSAGRR